MDFNEPLSLSLERRVLETIISICETYINKYPTTLDEDERLMGDRTLFAALTRQQRMAVKLRSSEKRILTRTMKAVADELTKLPIAMKNIAEKVPAAGRSFDTLKSKATIQNAKSVTDWVEMKGSTTTTNTKSTDTSTNNDNNSDDDSSSTSAGAASSTSSSVAERRRKRREGR